jgi:transcriptional regulator with GAF, ATPase, and Fis domain
MDTVLRPPLAELRRIVRDATRKVQTLAEAERERILKTLRETDWVIGGPDGASTLLGVKRTTLLDKMRRLGISRPRNLTDCCQHFDAHPHNIAELSSFGNRNSA